MKALLLISLLPLQLAAQDLTGIWTGYLQTSGNKLSYELAISEQNGRLAGYALTVFMFNGVENTGIKTVELQMKKETIMVEDGDLVYNNYTAPAKRSRLTGKLALQQNDSVMILTGTFSTRSLDFRDHSSYTGTVYLQKKKDTASTRLVAKLEEMNLLQALSFIKSRRPQNRGGVPTDTSVSIAIRVKETAPVPTNGTVSAEPVMEDIVPPAQKERQILLAPGRTQLPEQKRQPLTTRDRKNIVPPLIEEELVFLSSALKQEKQIATETRKAPSADLSPVISPKQKALAPFMDALPAPERAAAPAAALSSRKTEVIQDVFFRADSLVLSLYDNGTIDGDTVSVVVNGKIIVARKGLTANAIRTTLYITPDMGDSLQLVMYAENLGSIPPNTGLLVIQDGTSRNEIRFAGDMKKSSAVILRRRR